MPDRPHYDPRSQAEKARANLKANSELGLAVPESPIIEQPSVTPATFGVTNDKAKILSGSDQGLEAGGTIAGNPGAVGSQSIVESDQVTLGRNRTKPGQ